MLKLKFIKSALEVFPYFYVFLVSILRFICFLPQFSLIHVISLDIVLSFSCNMIQI